MIDYVVDASTAIHRLLRTPLGLQAERLMHGAVAGAPQLAAPPERERT